MLAFCRRLNAKWGPALVLALVLTTFLRISGPAVTAPSRDGFIAICSGSEIVYLPVSGVDGAVLPDPAGGGSGHTEHSIPCISLGHYVAVLPELPNLVARVEPRGLPAPIRRIEAHDPGDCKPFESQGPPLATA